MGKHLSMSIHDIAPVHWQMGQALLPDHLIAQENALTANTFLRHQASGLPFYGIGKLEWDKYLLAKGNLNLTSFRVFTHANSLLVDCPGNADIVSLPLELKDTSRVKVYYFILQSPPAMNTEQLPHNISETVARRIFKVILALQPALSEEYETLCKHYKVIDQGKLAEFVEDNNGGWKLSERFIPPLVQIGVSEFLLGPLKQLNILLNRYLKETLGLYQKQQLPDIKLFEIKHCINALYESQQFLANHIGYPKQKPELQLHPYFLYEQLQKLHRQLSLLSGEWAPLPLQNYQHSDLHGTFKTLFRNVVSRLKLHSRNSQSFQLHLKDGKYQTVLPDVASRKDNLYLVINCDQQPSLADEDLPCMSSHKRISTLFHYSLSGVGLIPVKHKALTHYFGQTTQCFRLQEGEELDHIIQEASLSFLAQPEFEAYSFFLFYQPQTSSSTGVIHAPIK
ncbi:MAG: type VI secretion system protein ImpJ [Paraglaciecola sp.]|jgi:type VI secretion system protein ImpJ